MVPKKKELIGRGKMTFLKCKPKCNRQMKKESEFKHMRNKWSRSALDHLKQARRCEQFVFRLELFAKKLGTSRHEDLNVDAIRGITKAIDGDSEWQTDLAFNISRKDRNHAKNTFLILVLKIAVAKFHALYAVEKGNAMKAAACEKEILMKIEGNGQWILAKQMGGKTSLL